MNQFNVVNQSIEKSLQVGLGMRWIVPTINKEHLKK